MKKTDIRLLENKTWKTDQTQTDVSIGEDMMLEIVRDEHRSILHYFINSNSTGRKKITRNQAIAYIDNHNEYTFSKY